MSDLSTAQLADLVAKSKLMMRIGDDDEAFQADAIAIYHDEGASASAATVQIESGSLILVITGGTNAGTETFDLDGTAYDTLTELVTAINALAKGWVATLLAKSDAMSDLLLRKAAASAFGQTNEQTLAIENNELLELLITNVFSGLESVLCRAILSTEYTEELHAPATYSLILKQPEITSVSMLALDTDDGLTVKYAGTDTHARVEVTGTGVNLVTVAGATTTSNSLTFAANVTTTAMATAVSAVSGWTGAVVTDGPSSYLVKRGTRDAKDLLVTLEAWKDWDSDYTVDYKAGAIDSGSLLMGERGQGLITYTAGLSEIPADLENVILCLVKTGWDSSTKDGALESEKLGDYAYKLRSVDSTYSPHASVIGKYKRVMP